MIHLIFLIVLFFLIPSINRYAPFYLIPFFILLLILVLRYDYGNDYLSYLNIYNAIKNDNGEYDDIEKLYYLMNLYSPSFNLIIGIISLYYIITIFFFIKMNLSIKQYWLAGLIWLINPYLFLLHLSSLRQTIAICLFIFATYFIIKKSFIKYCLVIIIAMNFHISAVILLPLYFFVNDKRVGYKMMVFLFLLIFVSIFTPIIDVFIKIVLPYFPVNYTAYFSQDTGNSIRATMLSSFYFFLILFNLNKLKNKELIYGKLSLIATILSILAYKVSMITRIGMYFDIFLIITIPMIFSKIKSKYLKLFTFSLMLTIYILRYYSFFTNPIFSEYYLEYKTILGVDFP